MKSRTSDDRQGAMEFSPRQTVLAGMAADGPGAAFDAVRLQKLFFLVDREIPDLISGPHFDYKPDQFGPFDEAVFDELNSLIDSGHVSVDTTFRCPLSVLTDSGVENGARILDRMPEGAWRYMKKAARWILTTSFRPMLSAIYMQYPDMAVNNVLPLVSKPIMRSMVSYPMPSFLSGMARALDLFGTLDEPRVAVDGAEADALATYNDWCAVGEDIEAAMGTLGQSIPLP